MKNNYYEDSCKLLGKARCSSNIEDNGMEGVRLTSGGPWKEYE